MTRLLALLFVCLLTGCVRCRYPARVITTPHKAIDLPPLTEAQQQAYLKDVRNVSVEFAPEWVEKKIHILNASGRDCVVSAASNLARVHVGASVYEWSQLAFVCPESGRIWIGPECLVYVETADNLFGLHTSSGLQWQECGVVKAYAYKLPLFDDLMLRYQKEAAYFYLLRDRPDFYYEMYLLRGDFMSNASTIKSAVLTNGILQIDLVSEATSPQEGTVWIDIRSREITRCVQSGKQVFPTMLPSN